MIKKIIALCALTYVFIVLAQIVIACTGINFTTADGKFIAGRSIEWGEYDLNSKLIIMPSGVKYQAFTPEGKQNGHKWTGKYGFAGISLINENFIGEGLNEAGLNAGMFYFPGFGSLSQYNKKKAAKSLSDMNLVTWLLTNFATVEEVKKHIHKIIIVPIAYESDGKPVGTAHWRVTDAKGGSIVIEITDGGKVNIYDNKAGVLTNSPQFPWHITNLSNYVNLRPGTEKTYSIDNFEIPSLGATSSLLGLPGDYTPPSRFVRAFFFLHTAPKAADGQKGIRQGFDLLKPFTIPIGLETEPGQKSPNLPSATQWTAFSNLSNREFYYNTMYNSKIRKIDLKKIDFRKAPKGVYPLEPKGQETFEEVLFN